MKIEYLDLWNQLPENVRALASNEGASDAVESAWSEGWKTIAGRGSQPSEDEIIDLIMDMEDGVLGVEDAVLRAYNRGTGAAHCAAQWS